MVASVYGLTNEVQNRYMARCIGDMVYFLISVTELRFVPGHVVDFIVVLAIALKHLENQHPQHQSIYRRFVGAMLLDDEIAEVRPFIGADYVTWSHVQMEGVFHTLLQRRTSHIMFDHDSTDVCWHGPNFA